MEFVVSGLVKYSKPYFTKPRDFFWNKFEFRAFLRIKSIMGIKSETAYQDSLLIERIKNGDNAAYDDMVTRYWDRIFARVYNLLRNQQDAEEVTQDAFIRAHRGLSSFRGDASFSTWLYQIATNLAHNRYWYWFRRKRDHSVSLDQQLTTDSDMTLEDVMPCKGETPSEAVLTNEFVERVSECMKDLSDKHREVLILRNIESLSYEEIAQKLNVSVGTVKSRIARARENLRVSMGSDF